MRFCLHPGCTKRQREAYCEKHGRKHERQVRGSSTERGYGRVWRAQAKAFLQEFPLCGHRPDGQRPVMSACHEAGRIVDAVQVDHVVPHRGDQALFWNRRNWQALCRECGARKSQAGL